MVTQTYPEGGRRRCSHSQRHHTSAFTQLAFGMQGLYTGGGSVFMTLPPSPGWSTA
jgi:hypothetical protein